MNDVMLTVFQVLIVVVGLLFTRFLIPYVKLKLTETVDEVLLKEIIKAVKSVEQDIVYTLGPEKKNEVLLRITKWANDHNIMVTQTQISQLIETAVWIMKYEDKKNE